MIGYALFVSLNINTNKEVIRLDYLYASILEQMPTIILFDGIKIELFANDHNPPHVHVKYAEYKCLLIIESATVYAGSMPAKPFKKAVNYVEGHREGLMHLWNLLQNK